MISSNSLEGIEVYKTVTPDMDAAVLGGTVNFRLREAEESSSGFPLVSLLCQGTYNDLMSTYKDFKFVAGAEQRYFDNRFGVFVQAIAQRQNLISNGLDASYYLPDKSGNPDNVALSSLNLSFSPNIKERYGGTITFDYRLPSGTIKLLNNISYSNTTNEQHSQTYNLRRNNIEFATQLWSNKLNAVTNILEYEQTIGLFEFDAKLSNAYSDNHTPSGWSVIFNQISTGISEIAKDENPEKIASTARTKIDPDNMYWAGNSTWSSYNKQNDTQFSLDLKRDFYLSNNTSFTLKTGGQFRYTQRNHNFDNGFGSLYTGAAVDFRNDIIQTLPWLLDDPYNLAYEQKFNIRGFYNQNMDFGKFLKGRYGIDSGVDVNKIDKVLAEIKNLGEAITAPSNVPAYVPDRYGSKASDYDGNEARSAVYFMGRINIGPQITIISGVRYQGLKTSYSAAHFIGNADAPNPYPFDLDYKWVTKDEYHGYWLPNAIAKYEPFRGLSFRVSYTNTLAYPDFYTIVPRMDISSSSGHWVVWNNYGLKPAYSSNYDFQVAVYNNEVGLFAVSPFLKRINNLIFSQSTYISDPSKYPGLPNNIETFLLSTFINNPHRVDVWGIETEWQTHFWYLPGPLSGLVLNINYTHIFSSADYPYTVTKHSPVYPFPTIHIDTTYTDRLIHQPNDIVNLSLGYDYKGFSILTSMIYQSQVYNGTDFYNSLRSDKENYLRWDLVINQKLPLYNIEVYLHLNNLNGAPDTYTVRGSGFPESESHYGLTADFGVRLEL
jgi:TonB-dependent receptor